MPNYHIVALISHTSKVVLKILQARFQQYVNHEIPDVQGGFRKGRGTRDQIANIQWIIEKAWEFQKNIYFSFIDYAEAFDCVDHNKLWKILKEMGIPDHLTCLVRNLCAGQEATVRTGHGTTDWFQIGKGVRQGCILSPCLFNLYAEYIQRRRWHPIPVLLPGKSHGWRSLVGCSPWGGRVGYDWSNLAAAAGDKVGEGKSWETGTDTYTLYVYIYIIYIYKINR